jgi:hypothetical protein
MSAVSRWALPPPRTCPVRNQPLGRGFLWPDVKVCETVNIRDRQRTALFEAQHIGRFACRPTSRFDRRSPWTIPNVLLHDKPVPPSNTGTKRTCRGSLMMSAPKGKTDVPREPGHLKATLAAADENARMRVSPYPSACSNRYDPVC